MAQPMNHQIADDLRNCIEVGELSRGAQLPTELQLREKYEASRNTIRDAIKRLISLGLVETRPGQGRFVVQKIDPFVTTLTGPATHGNVGVEGTAYLSEVSEQHRYAKTSAPRVEAQVPSAVIAGRLRVDPTTQAVSRHQERYIDDIPWSLQTPYYPMEFVTKAQVLRLLTAQAYPNLNEQIFFRIQHDATVFGAFRTGFDQHGQPMRLMATVYPADRNQFIGDVGNVPEPENNVDG